MKPISVRSVWPGIPRGASQRVPILPRAQSRSPFTARGWPLRNVSGGHLMREPGLNIDLRQVAEPGSEPPSPLLPAPRVKVVKTETGQAIELVPDGSGDLDTFRVRFLARTDAAGLVAASAMLGTVDATCMADARPARPEASAMVVG